jgi:hypothetical protein
MIKEIAQHLNDIITKGEYDNYRHVSRDIEDLSKLVYSVKSELELLEVKSELVQEIKDGLIENLNEASEILDKSETLLEEVEAELNQAAEEDAAHQDYCQDIFSER